MFEFLKRLCREEMMKRVPNTAKTAPAPNIEEPKPEVPKVLTDDEKLIIKAIQKSSNVRAGKCPFMPTANNGEYYLDGKTTVNAWSCGYAMEVDGVEVAFTTNVHGVSTISKAISERIHQDREEKRNKLNAMLGD